jgi:hypothetical protein
MPYSLKTLISNREKVELDGDQMNLITEGKCKIVAYEQLKNCKTIDECLGGKQGLIILYQHEQNEGHWCLLMKVGNGVLEFFDPYAIKMDNELKFSDYNLRIHQGEKVPHLTYLIEQSKYKLIQNTTQLQKYKHDVNTCGRWVAIRFRFREFSLKQFVDLFKNLDGDFYVSAMTILYSNFE